MSSDTIIDQPRTLTMNGVTFLVSEVAELQALFPTLDMLILPKQEIRDNVILQKAILSGAVVNKLMQAGDSATLNLTQAGRALLGKI